MNFFRLAVSRPVATSMFFLAIIVFGLYSFTRLPVDLFPDIDVPTLSVITTYNGAGALEVEQNVTDPLESALGTVPNLKRMRSNSLDDLSVVTLEFDDATDMGEAANDVRDRLARVRGFLPDDVDDPLVQKFDAGAIPVVIYTATARESFADLEQLIEDYLVGPLNRIAGVGDVSVTGAPQREVQVILNPERLEAYNLDIQSIAQALQAENISASAGRVDLGPDSYNLRVNTEFRQIEDIEEVIIAQVGGQSIHLRQVARVQEDFADEAAVSRINERQGVAFSVLKQSDANTVEVARSVRARMPMLIEGLPDDVEVQMIIDTSEFVVGSIDNLSNVLFYAVIFVVLVVLVFLRQWRATIVVAATIPVSLIVAFIYLALTGSTLNIISLSSLSIALGLVVDDAIVVLENIMRHIEKGSRPREAAVYGTREVGIAVLATTLTVVAVFLPLTFLSGSVGTWFGQLGFIVVVTVVTSTITALTLTPMMASLLLKKPRRARGPVGFVQVGIEKGLVLMEKSYGALLRGVLKVRKTVMLVCFLIFLGSLALIPSIGTEFMPVSDNGWVTVSGELETSRSLEFTAQVVEELEEQIRREIPEITLLSSTAGQSGDMSGISGGTNRFQLRMQLLPLEERERSVFDIADQVRDILFEVPEVVTYQVSGGASGGGGGGGAPNPISIQILGHNLEETTRLATELAAHMETVEGVRDITVSRGNSRPEFEFVFDREKLSRFGLTSFQVASAIRGNVAGQTATRYRVDGQEYDVVLRFEEESRNTLAQIEAMTVVTPLGLRVPVNELGELHEFEVPPSIDRLDRVRVIDVTAGLHGRSLNFAIADIQEWVDQQSLPPQIDIVFGGDFEEQQEAFFDLFLVLLLSIILVYLVMAAQFESLKEPFVIMFSIPFAFTGVLLALVITNTALSVIGFVGAIILVGIVVKNAIVLIDYIKLLRGRDYPVIEAIVEGGVSRLRPVLMTTLTTVLAMTPLALALGEGAEMWQPMAISVIGGLIFSTLVTMVLIPVMYGQFQWKAIRREREAALASSSSQSSEE